MNFFKHRSILLCGSLTMVLTGCVASPDIENEEESTATAQEALKATDMLRSDVLTSQLRAMWKKELNTTLDPANGNWFLSGADGDSPAGLYGALNLQPATAIVVNNSLRTYTSSAFVADDCIVDNRNGLNPNMNCTLGYTVSQSVSTTHGVENSISLGVGLEVTGSATLFGTGAEATASFTADYVHTWSQSTTKSDESSTSFSKTCTTTVPKGKVYKCAMKGIIRTFKAPYTVLAKVSGFTETWFSSKVNSHYNWSLSGSGAFQRIRDWNLAGSDSAAYSSAGFTQKGTLTANTKASFTSTITDITATYVTGAPAQSAKANEYEGTLVAAVPMRDALPPGLKIIAPNEQ